MSSFWIRARLPPHAKGDVTAADDPEDGVGARRIDGDGRGAVFFFQAEDGIRDYKVTGVQTCALPISSWNGLAFVASSSVSGSPAATCARERPLKASPFQDARHLSSRLGRGRLERIEIGRASCRERV